MSKNAMYVSCNGEYWMERSSHPTYPSIVTLYDVGFGAGKYIAAVFNFFIFNLNTYVSDDARASVQFYVRVASDFVTTELRNVETISTDDDTLDSILDSATLSAGNTLYYSK